ncbi:glycine cleavage system protein R [Salinivibrio sp. ES.052]|uniref:glycine cleavage system protein R n=1 Tax=Salinivibrio sp. ES.052 TaxID=1882823 RepID=UPI000929393C|nr:ACT domain-containing protein [Salinivibrio sp. ES.052]SIN73657.1 Glycine cleavage system regulatory protein [Salinivibrio sp. ES.052]
MKHFVITLVGPDRAGLVDHISHTVFAHHGSWQASRLSQLAGQFAGIIHVSVSDTYADALVHALRALDSLQLLITDATPVSPSPITHTLSVTGNDRRGIVQTLSQLLAAHGVTINKLNTQTQSAANTGGQIFIADFYLTVPDKADINILHEALETLSDDLIVDFDSNIIQ